MPTNANSIVRTHAPALLALTAAVLLNGCGGGGDDRGAADVTTVTVHASDDAGPRSHILAAAPAGWTAIPQKSDPLLQNLNIAADAPLKGMWSASMPWPMNAIHSILLPDGRVLTFGSTFGEAGGQDGRYFDAWTPQLGFSAQAHAGSLEPDPVNSFCGTSGWLADGTLLVAGGNGGAGKSTGIFSTTTNQTKANAATFAAERWYATMLALPDGRQLVLGGTVPYGSPLTSQTPEILENGSWRSLFGASSTPIFGVRKLDNTDEANPWYYPRAWVAPDGSVFGLTSNIMFQVLPDANNRAGSIAQIGTFKTTQDTSNATTPNVGFTSSAVMFAPGRILQVGGNGVTDNNGDLASLQASVIDINGATPVVTEAAPMSYRRHWSNATVLPTGKVVVTGGTTTGWEPANAVRPAEIWDPATNMWVVGASNVETRTYHSSAILLPNGTVFTAGGGAPGAVNNLNAEIYYPPYLFATINGQAQLAARPAFSAFSSLQGAYAGNLGIEMADAAAVARLVLVATGSTTHSFNNTQRFVPLTFKQNGSTLSAALPATANLAPPGYYMVFAINANGVPSAGVMISLGGLKAPALEPVVIPPNLPTTAAVCAAEYGTCTTPVGQIGTVYFGANGIVAAKAGVTGAVACTSANFGGDPYSGKVKSCYYAPQGPANATWCAPENGNCSIPAGQTATVTYGANGAYSALPGKTGSVACNTATFGGDPIFGVVKSCFYNVTAVATPPSALPAINAPAINAGGTASYAPAANLAGASYVWTFGDNTAATNASTSPNATHVFAAAGVYAVKLSAKLADGSTVDKNFLQAVVRPATARSPTASSAMALEVRAGASSRLWVVNPDNDSVSVIDTATNARTAEIAVGASPRSVAVASDGRIWVSNKASASISIVNPATLAVVQTVNLARASQPHGLAFAPGGGSAYVVLEAGNVLVKLDPVSGAQQGSANVGANARHVSLSADGATALVSRFITSPMGGESTASVTTTAAGGEVLTVATATMSVTKTIVLQHSDKTDGEAQGAGIPNYLGAAVISPDGGSAWVPSKQDNIKRGTLRSGQNLTFQNSVRAISSRIDMGTLAEDYARRVDHDNSSLGSAAAFHPNGAYLFVALETSQQVAVLDAAGGRELLKFDVGRAPQGLTVSADGKTLYVQNFMDRSASVLDLSLLVAQGQLTVPLTATVGTSNVERLSAQVLRGKQLFYDARDPRMARDSYMSCASCHSDGGHDGRTWDFTGLGEGLRNTTALKGRAGNGQGFLHWSANFDEVQDFEGQIRSLAGGTGLMADADFNAGTRSQPLGDKKAGRSVDLDALAAYLSSFATFAPSPYRSADGTLTAAAQAGKAVFSASCASCHGGVGFTTSADGSQLKNIGTLKASSGKRLNGTLAGIDIPTLRDVWATAPYLHDGSAATLPAAVSAHNTGVLSATDLANLVAYVQQIGSDEAQAIGNLALGKPATQSSDEFGGSASRAVDGRTDGAYGNSSVTHTGYNWNQWWQVDLQSSNAFIDSVRIWNRTDCCASRLANFTVFVSATDMTGRTLEQLNADATVWRTKVASMNGADNLTVAVRSAGRYVRVQLDKMEYLSLAEVQVMGTPVANLAQGKPATQSSDGFGGWASKAVDGNTDGAYSSGNSVTHTEVNAQAWWQVDLGRLAALDAVQLWNRTDCCSERLANFYVLASPNDMTGKTLAQLLADPAVKPVPIASLSGNASIGITMSGFNARYVRVQLSGTDYLSLAEVQVMGR